MVDTQHPLVLPASCPYKAKMECLVQASYSELGQESLLHWPAVSSTMAPELFSLYKDAMTSKQELVADRQRTVSKAAERMSAMDEATAAAVAADERAAAAAAEPEAALDGGAAAELGDPTEFGGPVDMEGVQGEGMDHELPQPTMSDQGFAAGKLLITCSR